MNFLRRITESQNRKQSLDDINLDQFLKIANYEDTVKELDIYYGIGKLNNTFGAIFNLLMMKNSFLCLHIVKRQLLQFQSPISGLFPVLSTDTEVGSVRDSVYCAAAVWSLYQAYRYVVIQTSPLCYDLLLLANIGWSNKFFTNTH